MRIATFNVQNLRLRRDGANLRLDGARDYDADEAPAGVRGEASLAAADRELTAQVIAHANADIVALQEVFNQATLDHFHAHCLSPRGMDYPYRYCLEGNDGHSSDVAVMSRHRLDAVVSHARLSFDEIGASAPLGVSPRSPVFRRDCLAVRSGALWLFVCHFKAQADDAASASIRRAEAKAVRYVIERSVDDPQRTPWLVLGDFNAHDAAGEADLAALAEGAVDLGARARPDEAWTFYDVERRRYSRPDRIFAAPHLAAGAAAPHVVRIGMALSAKAHARGRLSGVGLDRPHASDHALLMLELLPLLACAGSMSVVLKRRRWRLNPVASA